MDYIWIIYGLYIDYIWIICGLYMDYILIIYGLYARSIATHFSLILIITCFAIFNFFHSKTNVWRQLPCQRVLNIHEVDVYFQKSTNGCKALQ